MLHIQPSLHEHSPGVNASHFHIIWSPWMSLYAARCTFTCYVLMHTFVPSTPQHICCPHMLGCYCLAPSRILPNLACACAPELPRTCKMWPALPSLTLPRAVSSSLHLLSCINPRTSLALLQCLPTSTPILLPMTQYKATSQALASAIMVYNNDSWAMLKSDWLS